MRSTLINKRKVFLAGALALVAVCLSAVLAHAEPEKKTDTKTAPKKLTGAELNAGSIVRAAIRSATPPNSRRPNGRRSCCTCACGPIFPRRRPR